MKLPIILHIKIDASLKEGFLIGEAIIAFSLMTLFVTSSLILSITMQALHTQAKKQLENIEWSSLNISSTTLYTTSLYGNDTQKIFLDPLEETTSDYDGAWGKDSCDPRITFNPDTVSFLNAGMDLGAGNISTDIEARHGVAYLTADGSLASSPDFYIIDMHDPAFPVVVSSLNTGPGASAIAVAGPYAYVANLSTTNQLQVIDIRNRNAPVLAAKFKLPLPLASTSPPLATSIYFDHGLIYLGTEKWDGNEFSVIDVTIPENPHYIGGFEMGTLVSSMYIRKGIAYVTASSEGQLRVLDVHNPLAITQIGIFTPSGWETQEGKSLSFFEGELMLGRTTGGFDVLKNHEIFAIASTLLAGSTPAAAYSHNIPGGVYGIVDRPPFVYLASRASGHEFQIWKKDLSMQVYEKALGFFPAAMACDGSSFYFATGNARGVAVLKIK